MKPYKVVIVGNSGTGKTSILNRYVYGKFNTRVPTTIGVEFSHKSCDDETKLVLWDTAGQERFKSLMGAFYRGAHAIMFVYDVGNVNSFRDLDRWQREYRSYGDTTKSIAILVGNKTDVKRIVSKDEAMAWAVGHNICYEEVSSKNGTNIDGAFNTLVNQLKSLPEVQQDKIEFRNKPKSDRCCY